ncbi:MAG TPA: heat-inducible transcription repressor HrcA [Nitrospirae bacterium]|nr:heat-inducible transcription repressor HrcA [Nitrospirota bacterium]
MPDDRDMLDERSIKVLWAVIHSYINNPDPVGSRYVTRKYAFDFSPATIRNIMADLEDMGFLSQPHTSAGRIPTDKGYRFYVENLMDEMEENVSVHEELIESLTKRLDDLREDIYTLLDETTRTLSTHSHYLGIAVSPGPDGSTLRRIELFPYSDDRIAVILFTNEGIIKHKILKNSFSFSRNDLNKIARYLNREFSGYTIKEIRRCLFDEMARDKALCDSLISRALSLCGDVVACYGSNVFISGLSEILELPEFSDVEKVKELSRTIEDKHAVIKLIDSLANEEGVQVIIGTENTIEEMKAMSIIASTYKEGDKPAGVVGIIGPTRMDYSSAISLVDVTARYLTKILDEGGRQWRRER